MRDITNPIQKVLQEKEPLLTTLRNMQHIMTGMCVKLGRHFGGMSLILILSGSRRGVFLKSI